MLNISGSEITNNDIRKCQEFFPKLEKLVVLECIQRSDKCLMNIATMKKLGEFQCDHVGERN